MSAEATLDTVDRPAHYVGKGGIEAADVWDWYALGPHLWQAASYIVRHHRKGRPIEDLKKARWYVRRAGALGKRRPPTCVCGLSYLVRIDSDHRAVADAFGLEGWPARALESLLYTACLRDASAVREGLASTGNLLDLEICRLDGADE